MLTDTFDELVPQILFSSGTILQDMMQHNTFTGSLYPRMCVHTTVQFDTSDKKANGDFINCKKKLSVSIMDLNRCKRPGFLLESLWCELQNDTAIDWTKSILFVFLWRKTEAMGTKQDQDTLTQASQAWRQQHAAKPAPTTDASTYYVVHWPNYLAAVSKGVLRKPLDEKMILSLRVDQSVELTQRIMAAVVDVQNRTNDKGVETMNRKLARAFRASYRALGVRRMVMSHVTVKVEDMDAFVPLVRVLLEHNGMLNDHEDMPNEYKNDDEKADRWWHGKHMDCGVLPYQPTDAVWLNAEIFGCYMTSRSTPSTSATTADATTTTTLPPLPTGVTAMTDEESGHAPAPQPKPPRMKRLDSSEIPMGYALTRFNKKEKCFAIYNMFFQNRNREALREFVTYLVNTAKSIYGAISVLVVRPTLTKLASSVAYTELLSLGRLSIVGDDKGLPFTLVRTDQILFRLDFSLPST